MVQTETRVWKQYTFQTARCHTRRLEVGDLLVVRKDVPLSASFGAFQHWVKGDSDGSHRYPIVFAQTDAGQTMLNLSRGWDIYQHTPTTTDLTREWAEG